MQPHDDGPSTTRREFLAQTGALAAVALSGGSSLDAEEPAAPFEPVKIPDWVHGVTRMAFVTPGDVGRAAKAGAQVVHTNVVWPYFPLRRDGGGLSEGDARRLRDLVADCRRGGVRAASACRPSRRPRWSSSIPTGASTPTTPTRRRNRRRTTTTSARAWAATTARGATTSSTCAPS